MVATDPGRSCRHRSRQGRRHRPKAEREATKDPRPSLAERYRDNADYSERVKAAATALERDGYLLPEDTKRIVERAAKLTW
jgi:hypothetical protein